MPTAGEFKHELTENSCLCFLRRRRARDFHPTLKSCFRKKVTNSFATKSKKVTFDPVLRIRNFDNLEEKKKLVLTNDSKLPPNPAVRNHVLVSRLPANMEKPSFNFNCSETRPSRIPIQGSPLRMNKERMLSPSPNCSAYLDSNATHCIGVNLLEKPLQTAKPLTNFSFFQHSSTSCQRDFLVSPVFCEYDKTNFYASSEGKEGEELNSKNYVTETLTPAKMKNPWPEGLQCQLKKRKEYEHMLSDFEDSRAEVHKPITDDISTKKLSKSLSSNGSTKKGSLLYELLRTIPIAFFWTGCTFLIALIYVFMYPNPNER